MRKDFGERGRLGHALSSILLLAVIDSERLRSSRLSTQSVCAQRSRKGGGGGGGGGGAGVKAPLASPGSAALDL